MVRTYLKNKDFEEPCFNKAFRILNASKKVLIWGDEDPDGITATSIMKILFDFIGIENIYYVPSRKNDGIGLNIGSLESMMNLGFDTVITVDCGIVNNKQIKYLKNRHINVIITDHHIPYNKLEKGAVYIDTHLLKNRKFSHLSGAGLSLAFSLYAASKKLDIEFDKIDVNILRKVFALASIGTKCDRVQIKGYNKKIRMSALQISDTYEVFSKFKDENEMCGIIASSKTSGRKNSAVEIFTGLSTERKAELQAGKMNQSRINFRLTADRWLKLVRKKIDLSKRMIIVKDLRLDAQFSGIIASRLTEELHKPVLIISKRGKNYSGESRSEGKFNWIELFEKYSNLFISWGGHKQAAGFSIKKEHIDAFIDMLDDDYNS